ncbi:MAG: transglutaminase domain-containing protein, partial [Thermoplasmata archaeon]|nr:transglutaminase domain-containing protein [Thermoplasmata archaeon]
MNHKVLAGIFGALLIFSSIMGVIASLNFPEAEAFAQEELHVPDQFISQGLEPMPPLAGDWPTLPNIPALISIGNIYREYGGSVRIQIQNNGTRDIFLEQVAFEWTNSGRGSSIMVHQYIDTGSAYDVKTLSIPGPSTAGNHSYQISMQVLIYRNNGWFRVIAGGDDWLDLTEHTIEVVELVEPNEYDLEHNYRAYYERVNELVSFDSENVASAAAAATEGMGDEYNIGKVCAIFDYLDDNCVYTEDPGGDKWYSPDELLDSLEGDCEDYAMLIAAMVENIGGTTRVYLTHDHAFAAVYVGNSTEEYEQASNDIQSYYGTDVKTHAMVDETGYWINVDPLGTFYAG